MTWRERAAPIITKILVECKDKSEKELKKALREAYPFGQRDYHPYKVWLDEIKRQRGLKSVKKSEVNKLIEWEEIYGKRNEEMSEM